MQSKAFAELQETAEILQKTKQRMMDQMKYLEDTVCGVVWT